MLREYCNDRTVLMWHVSSTCLCGVTFVVLSLYGVVPLLRGPAAFVAAAGQRAARPEAAADQRTNGGGPLRTTATGTVSQ
jgi:hypothetical protein